MVAFRVVVLPTYAVAVLGTEMDVAGAPATVTTHVSLYFPSAVFRVSTERPVPTACRITYLLLLSMPTLTTDVSLLVQVMVVSAAVLGRI